MITTTLEGIQEFLEHWNNGAINQYNFYALTTGVGFTLKWFITKEDFDTISKKIDYKFGEGETRMFIEIGEDRIELEIDNRNIISEFKESVKGIDEVFSSFEK